MAQTRKKKKRKKKMIRKLLVLMSMILLAVILHSYFISEPANDIHKVAISPNEIYSSNAILIRLEDNSVLMEKNSIEKIYPASLTKIMTAIVALENLENLKSKIELTHATFEGLYESNAALAGFEPGEKVSAIDLLYGMMLPSGAECSIALAQHITGSEQEFVELMNQKAESLGMDDTHFENATGLHHEQHYSTVKDMGILLSYGLENNTFREIFTSAKHSTKATNKNDDGITFYSTMFKKMSDPNLVGGKILGGKTGYTKEAGLCLASIAEKNAQEYILVTVGAQGDSQSEQFNIIDAIAIYSGL